MPISPQQKRLGRYKRAWLIGMVFIFSVCSVGIGEDFEQWSWLKAYFLLTLVVGGNLLIYLSFYPRLLNPARRFIPRPLSKR